MKSIKQFASLGRTMRLLHSFPQEQKNPAQFYIPLAQDTLAMIELFRESASPSACAQVDEIMHQIPTILDVGGGPGFFSQVFSEAGWHYTSVDVDAGDFEKYGYTNQTSNQVDAAEGAEQRTLIPPIHIHASGYHLPFHDNSFDIVLCSNVAEHVPAPWELAEELLRVLRPGGLLFYSYTIWFGPFGGHETGLWHYLGGNFAARRYQKKYGNSPKNLYGTSLFRVDARTGISWAHSKENDGQISLIGLFPRYHPWWSWRILSVPIVRELLTSNLMIILAKK